MTRSRPDGYARVLGDAARPGTPALALPCRRRVGADRSEASDRRVDPAGVLIVALDAATSAARLDALRCRHRPSRTAVGVATPARPDRSRGDGLEAVATPWATPRPRRLAPGLRSQRRRSCTSSPRLAVAVAVIAFIPHSTMPTGLPAKDVPGLDQVSGLSAGVTVDPASTIAVNFASPRPPSCCCTSSSAPRPGPQRTDRLALGQAASGRARQRPVHRPDRPSAYGPGQDQASRWSTSPARLASPSRTSRS